MKVLGLDEKHESPTHHTHVSVGYDEVGWGRRMFR